MKQFLFIVFVAVIIAGCDKKDIAPAGLIGKWEVRNVTGTIAGTSVNYPKGNGRILKFNADSTFSSVSSEYAAFSGKFSIKKKGITFAGKIYDAIIFNNGEPDYLFIKADTLVIGNTYPDGIASTYVKTE